MGLNIDRDDSVKFDMEIQNRNNTDQSEGADMERTADNETAEMQENTAANGEVEEELGGKAVLKEIFSWIMTIALAFAFAFFMNHVIIVNANVPTGSMENTIMPGDRVIGNRLAYLSSDPQRGDIVMFKYPVDEKEIYIKRVIGLPGETIEIREAKVYINGNPEPLYEPYLKEEWVVASDGLSLNIPEGCYFCMGDNRNNSADSRYWAGEAVQAGVAKDYADAVEKGYCFVKKEKILGKAMFRYFPKPKTFDAVEY